MQLLVLLAARTLWMQFVTGWYLFWLMFQFVLGWVPLARCTLSRPPQVTVAGNSVAIGSSAGGCGLIQATFSPCGYSAFFQQQKVVVAASAPSLAVVALVARPLHFQNFLLI